MKGMIAALLGLLIASPALANDGKKAETKDIVETAVAAGSFTTLAKALTEAGLVETLQGKGPYTVFAPTDEAFANVPKPVLEALLKDKEKLTKVLLYHVVSGEVKASDVVKLKEARTVEGLPVKISVDGDVVRVNDARVVKTDILASNGVIHVIDTVIMPPAEHPTKMHTKSKSY